MNMLHYLEQYRLKFEEKLEEENYMQFEAINIEEYIICL